MKKLVVFLIQKIRDEIEKDLCIEDITATD